MSTTSPRGGATRAAWQASFLPEADPPVAEPRPRRGGHFAVDATIHQMPDVPPKEFNRGFHPPASLCEALRASVGRQRSRQADFTDNKKRLVRRIYGSLTSDWLAFAQQTAHLWAFSISIFFGRYIFRRFFPPKRICLRHDR